MISLVEQWAEEDLPTPRARIAQARALLNLRLMDRAWVALREVVDSPEHSLEAHRLTARMFMLRGWPKRARSALQKGLAESPQDMELNNLWEAAARPQEPLDDSEPTSPGEALEKAEARLARGELLRAQRLLEGVRRDEPDNKRAEDLLWALEGDFRLEGTLADLVRTLGPGISDLVDLADDAEHTESITAEELDDLSDETRFPTLFRESGDPITEEYEDGAEVTQTRLMASTKDMIESLDDFPEGLPEGGDTQILRVIEKGDRTELKRADGNVHVGPTDAPELNFDLDAYRREMGVLDANAGHPGSDLEPLETEDNDVIVFTHREFTDSIQGLEPDPSEDTMSHPDARRFLSDEARTSADKEFMARARAAAELERRAIADEITVKTAAPSPQEDRPRKRNGQADFVARHAGWIAALVVALLLAIFVLVFAIGVRMFSP